ncbi:helix-turn-helix transcriptional regulator [Terrisporobacter petrolearius]|uniref:helix-turn-helix transcriptional regulator n=1 Tax=Terrisporobacter petrolearius TaxID=1460447 RepID=UPI0031CCAE88
MIKLNFGNNLKKLRAENNLSQEQLAKKLNLPCQAISKWELGKEHPDMEDLVMLRDIFHVTIDDLVINDNIVGCKDSKKRNLALKDIYIEPNYNKNGKLVERSDNIRIYLMTVGSIIGMVVGILTNNPIWAVIGTLVGIGIGNILELVIKKG